MLKRIKLSDFRNYREAEYELADKINLVIGLNAKGKTNLLEAIYLLGVGESFRAKRTEEMVAFGQELGRVSGEVEISDGDKMSLEVLVSGGLVMGKRVNKRKYLIDGASRRKQDLLGLIPIVLFRPEDVELISGSPDVRRKFLDRLLSQVDKVYGASLTTYEQALKRRNKLLDAIREGSASKYSLTFWDGLLIKHGEIIQTKRREFLDFTNTLFGKSDLFKELTTVYDMSAISEARLEKYKEAEVAIGYTLVGPHKDDIAVKDKTRDLATYGSRGEQRMAVLAMKMAEIYYMEEKGGKKVLLLLDDIFSELDGVHKEEVLRVMEGRQVVVTSADEGDTQLFKKVKTINLS